MKKRWMLLGFLLVTIAFTGIMIYIRADNNSAVRNFFLHSWHKNYVVEEKNLAYINTTPKQEQVTVLSEVKDFNFKKQKNLTSGSKKIELQEVKESDLKRERNLTSESKETEPQEVNDFAPNYNNTNYNNQSHNDINYINPINQSGSEDNPDKTDVMDDVNAYIELIKDNIEYEHHMKYDDWQNKALYEELFEVICEVVCVKRTTIRIAGEDYPYELVKSKFLKLNSGHLEYVIGCMHDTNTKITNIKAYMVTALYNAPSTMNHYYQQEVQHDMYGGGWHEKGIV